MVVKCDACQAVGMWHCSDPEHCGNMKMATSYEYWDDIYIKVKTLRDQGMTILQIEEETNIDYEDILWAIHQEEVANAHRT